MVCRALNHGPDILNTMLSVSYILYNPPRHPVRYYPYLR